ncbi:MAG TPA: hypothetical protein VMR33_00040 [Candidatus Baltobacteraceae bacterium]|nr:hypothetical protein [Candidatus Baltobacteraceae bacterium]
MRTSFPPPLLALLSLAFAGYVGAADFPVTTSVSPPIAGTTTGDGSFPSGSSVTVTALPNDCFEFVEWRAAGVKVSTENPYTFTVTKKQTLVAAFAQLKYDISTTSSPLHGGTTGGGGKKGCGTTATLTAHAKPGFAFVDWTVVGEPGVTIPSATCKITVSDNATFVANFIDVRPPEVKILSPTKSEKIGAAAFPVQGTASDSVGIEAVYYNLNGTGWNDAVISCEGDEFTNWYAWVTLTPNSANTVSVYAVNTLGNKATNTVKFICTAAGLAPVSIAGHQAGVTTGTNTHNSFIVSFDSAVYASVSSRTNDGGEVGTYTYTPTGPDTGELVPHRVFPTQDTGSNGPVLELTFTDGYTATYIDNSSNNGTLYFVVTEDIAPATLDGSTLIAASFVTSNYVSTNYFDSSTYTTQDSLGASSSGTYTFTKFTAVAALVMETATNPPSAIGTTNYIVLSLTNVCSQMSGYYDYDSVSATTNQGSDAGTFVLNPGIDDTPFVGPVALSGLQAVITPTGEPFSFTRTFGNGTFASISLETTNGPADVGINLANTRVSANAGSDQFMALAPPYALGMDDETVDLTFTSSNKATFVVEGSPDQAGSITYSELANYAPAALTGHTITATPTGKDQTTSVITFTNNIFKATGGALGGGTYTYAPYTPTMALVQTAVTSGADAGETAYLLLQFASTNAGSYIYSKIDPASPGGWIYTPGKFKFATTK